MTWNPDSDKVNESFDMATNVVKIMDSRNKFKGSNGKSFSESVFPKVRLQDQDGPQATRIKQKLKGEKAFLEDYWDRRATAKYVS